MATPYAVLISEWSHVKQPLPDLNVPADHPIKRTAVKQVVDPPRHHSRRVKLFRRKTGRSLHFELLLYPVGKAVDRLATDAEFDQVKGHVPRVDENRISVNSLPKPSPEMLSNVKPDRLRWAWNNRQSYNVTLLEGDR